MFINLVVTNINSKKYLFTRSLLIFIQHMIENNQKENQKSYLNQ